MSVQRSLFNLFEGSDPDEPLIGSLNPAQSDRRKSKFKRRQTLKASALNQDFTFLDRLGSGSYKEKRNAYHEVKKFLPERTDIIDDALFMLARFNTTNTTEFQIQLQRVTDRDPEMIAKLMPPTPIVSESFNTRSAGISDDNEITDMNLATGSGAYNSRISQ